MSLIIFIPTFQRPKTLMWSLDSVLKQNFNKEYFKKIYIINNDIDTKVDVENCVETCMKNNHTNNFDSIEILQGDNSIPGTKNLYGIIKSNSSNEDVAIIHCDDDIMLPDTLDYRYFAALNSNFDWLIAKAIGTAFFFTGQDNVYFNDFDKVHKQENISYQEATVETLTNYSIPFLSVYTFKTNKGFWNLYDQAINWSDAMPYEPRIKYPFVPFFIGLAAYKDRNLACSDTHIVIRGQLFKLNRISLPIVVTEYANTGIVLLTGLSVLMNRDLINDSNFDNIRIEFKKNTDDFLLQTLFKRDGVKFNELKYLFETTNTSMNSFNFIKKINFKTLRNLFNNLIFDTRFIMTSLKGWGEKSTITEFWNKLQNKINWNF